MVLEKRIEYFVKKMSTFRSGNVVLQRQESQHRQRAHGLGRGGKPGKHRMFLKIGNFFRQPRNFQELPEWLERVAGDSARYGGSRPGMRGKGQGNRFGGKAKMLSTKFWSSMIKLLLYDFVKQSKTFIF